MTIKRGGASDAFELVAGERGVLLLHGFTGTPFEMRPLGEALCSRGFTVSCPLLAGHGQAPSRLNGTTWRDWVASADSAFVALKRRSKKVAVVGLSMGGLIALHLARNYGNELTALAALATPLWLPWHARLAIPIVRNVRDLLIRKSGGGADLGDHEMRAANPTMGVFPATALGSLLDLTKIVRSEIRDVAVPTFVAHGHADHTVPLACSEELVRHLGTRDVRFCHLMRSFHIVTLDVERDFLARELGEFLDAKM